MPAKKKKHKADGKTEKPQFCIIHFPKFKQKDLQCLNQKTYDKIKYVADLRRSLKPGSNEKFADVCKKIPATLENIHGYHRKCYQKFTNRIKDLTSSEDKGGQDRNKTRQSNRNMENNNCVFCKQAGRRRIKRGGSWVWEPLHDLTIGQENLLQQARSKNDDSMIQRLNGYGNVSDQIKMHSSCRSDYMQNIEKWRSCNEETKEEQQVLEETHLLAFEKVCSVVKESIIQNKTVMKLSDLKDIYIECLEESEFRNQQYRSEKLKSKLESHPTISQNIAFLKLEIRNTVHSYLIYNSSITIEEAVGQAYQLGTKSKLKEVAEDIRDSIFTKFKNAKKLPWPPDETYLNQKNVLPPVLLDFLRHLFQGKKDTCSEKIKRLQQSIGQDICRAVTNSQWKLPKHILLCMTLRHMFRSKELITLINRFGHSENHSFSLELETAIASAMQVSSSLLTNRIIRDPNINLVFHSEFDNFDQLLNDMSGKGSVHTAHGIMMQEISQESPESYHVLPQQKRIKQRSWDIPNESELEDVYVSQRRSPNLVIEQHSIPGSSDSQHSAVQEDMAWLFLRMFHEKDQTIPGWSGFVSTLGEVPLKITTLDYYPAIYKPITQYSTVQECLRYAEEATNEVGQYYVYTTFDLGVCMKAYPLIWNFPEFFERHIVLIGTFHLNMGYFKMLGKKMEGSGFLDVLIESDIISPGSVNGVLSGKNYKRASYCHRVMFEGLHRLLIKEFTRRHTNDLLMKVEEIVGAENGDLKNIIMNERIRGLADEYLEFCSSVRTGSIGKTGQFWLSYMDHVGLTLCLNKSVKNNNFELYAFCIDAMSDLFFAYGGQNYSRYLTFFSTFLTNLEKSHPGSTEQLKLGVFSVARSKIPGNRCAVDKTMEETFMKHAKSKGGAGGSGAGLTGITHNLCAYQRWIRTTPERCRYYESTYDQAGLAADSSKEGHHKETYRSEISRYEKDVQSCINAINCFMNPFQCEDNEHLYNISSGARIPLEMEEEILQAESLGKKQKAEFVKERLATNSKFFDPVKKLKLKTMADHNKVTKIRNSQNKTIQYKQQGNIAFQVLIKAQNLNMNINMQELIKYQLTPVPYSLATTDGFLAKTNKAKGLDYLTKGVSDSFQVYHKENLLIMDGNAVYHMMTEIPDTFKAASEKVFKMIPGSHDVIFSTDMYAKHSIKAQERVRRGCGDPILIKGPAMKRPQDWKNFLANDKNKEQFTDMILNVWSSDSFAATLGDRKVIFISRGKAYQLMSEGNSMKSERIFRLDSNQEETDTRVALYAQFAAEEGYKSVQVRSPDSDIYFILLHHATKIGLKIYFDTGSGNKKRILNITEQSKELGEKRCEALLSLHALTGCDTSSCLKGKGKIQPIKVLEKHEKFDDVLCKIGEDWNLGQESVSDIERFVCYVYGNSRCKEVDQLRYNMLQKKCNNSQEIDPKKTLDLGSLPPCQSSLLQHIKRVNYQVRIWKLALENYLDIPSPLEHGWKASEGGLEPLWSKEEILPQEIIDIMNEGNDDDSDEDMIPESSDSDDSDSDLID